MATQRSGSTSPRGCSLSSSSSRRAHQEDLVDIRHGKPRAAQGHVHRVQGLVDVGLDQRLVVVARDFQGQMHRQAVVFQQVFLGKGGVGPVRQRDLGGFGRAL
jgi:hypothetical protein